MPYLYFALGTYLTYYTFKYARNVWKKGNKGASVVLFLLSASFPILTFFLIILPK